MRKVLPVTGLLLALALPASVARAQSQAPAWPTVKEEHAGLLARAQIRPDSAWKIALARVPGGEAVKGEIETEDGQLVYSLEFTVAGRSGVQEVLVNAKTGKVVSVEHESASAEAREQDHD